MNQPIPSPYTSADKPKATKEVLKKILELTKAGSVFLILSDDTASHECTPETCKGHYMDVNDIGFSPNQIMGIAAMIARNFGYKLVPIEEEN